MARTRTLIQDWKPRPSGGAGDECDADGAPSGDEVESGVAVAAEAPPEVSVLEPPATAVARLEARMHGERTGLTGVSDPRYADPPRCRRRLAARATAFYQTTPRNWPDP